MEKQSTNLGKKQPTELSFDQLYEGYSKSIETGLELFSTGQDAYKKHPSIALGIFQIAQEEIGRSLSFLAAFNFVKGDHRWSRFFSHEEWKSHPRKAHRAFLYEIICPIRITSKDGRLDGFPKRDKISDEKEAALYTNFDSSKGKFLSPMENVSQDEVLNRYITVLYLSTTAHYVKAGLDMESGLSKEENYRLFSDIPERIITQNIYQQDFPAIMEEFEERSDAHAAIRSNLRKALDAEKEMLYSTQDQFRDSKEPKEI